MSLCPSALETIVPYRYVTFTLPYSRQDDILQIAVLDYPLDAIEIPGVNYTAAMWVPPGRETDWIFSTFSGHLHLLLSAQSIHPLSRLILVSNAMSNFSSPMSFEFNIHSPPSATLQISLAPLLISMTPKSAISCGGDVPEVPLLVYEDDVTRSSILEICEGPQAGEMLIENVELETDGAKEYRRRLRFKRMPNLVQTQMRIYPKNDPSLLNLKHVEFELDTEVLVQPYLIPMTLGILMISQSLEDRLLIGFRPKALCLGVGGGALVGFLASKLKFEVVGVEEDEVVLQVANKHFGLESNELIHLFCEDGIRHVKTLAKCKENGGDFDIIMVDLDSSDPISGPCVAPPVKFIRKSVIIAIRDVLCQKGVVIVNTVPVTKFSSEKLIGLLHEFFVELHEVDVGNEDNFVLIATKCEVDCSWSSNEGVISSALKSIVPRLYADSIRKIPKK